MENVALAEKKSQRSSIFSREKISMLAGILVFVVVFAFFSFQAPGFFSLLNLERNILMPSSIAIVLALAMTVVMIGGGIDLSVIAISGLSGLASAAAVAQFDFGLPGMIIAAILGGAFVGVINGVLVAYVGISPFVVTLSVVFLVDGLQYLVALGAVSGTYIMLSREVTRLGSKPAFLIGTALGVSILLKIFLDHTVAGRYLRSIGKNLTAARFSGISVRFHTFLSYVIASVLCAIGGIMLTFTEGMARVGSGDSYLIDAFLLPILGQTIFGKFSVEGTVFGALFMYMLINGLYILGAPPESIRIVKGTLLLAIILLSGVSAKKN